MKIIDNVIFDCGLKYVVFGVFCVLMVEVKVFIKIFCKIKKFVKVIYNIWVVLLDEGLLKNDDGESGVGMVIV